MSADEYDVYVSHVINKGKISRSLNSSLVPFLCSVNIPIRVAGV